MSGTPAKTQDFKVRACGNLYKEVDHFIGKFTMASNVFEDNKAGWQLRQKHEDASVKRRRTDAAAPRATPWELLDKSGQVKHTGHPELGMTSAGGKMSYFVLVKEGSNFTALPVKDWYSFRPNVRPQKVLTLEEAEQKMTAVGNNIHLNTNSRLGALAAKAEQEGGEEEEGNDEGEQPDSDEERETQRAARMKAAQTEAANGGTAVGQTTPPGAVHADKAEKGEDWEHEDERADDDLEQGDEEGSDAENGPSATKRSPPPEPDSDADDQTLTGEGQEINRILRRTHLSSQSGSDAEPASTADSDADNDDLDLDAMASKLMPNELKTKRERSSSVPESTDLGATKSRAGSKDSRQPTPQLSTANMSKRKAGTPPLQTETKKARPESRAQPKESSTQSEATSGPPSAQEIADCLRAWGPVTASELTSRFKKRLPSKEDKKNFTANVKRVSKLEERPPGSGQKFVVLK